MTTECTVTGCHAPPSGYSPLCERHKKALRRHGHAQQEGVLVHELAPFKARIVARRNRNPGSPVWDILEQRWEAVKVNAERVLRGAASGKPHNSDDLKAAHHIAQLGKTAAPGAVVDTALAMFLMLEDSPQRFRSDKAFAYQLARRVHALTDMHAGTYWDEERNKVKRVYRDMTPATIERLSEPLRAAFGVAGVYLAELDRKDAKAKNAKRQELMDALKGLK